MTPFYDKCISVVLKSEGGYQCDPDDRGNYHPDGRLIGTKYGISARLFPKEDIKNMTIERAKYLYWRSYWKPMNIDTIADDLLILHLLDFGINAGKRRSIRTIQRIVGATPDGICGPLTLLAISKFAPIIKGGVRYTACDFFISARKAYYQDLANRRPVYKKFLRGWLNRVTNCHF